MVAQEHSPGRAGWNLRGFLQHLVQTRCLLGAKSIENAGHDREVKSHVALRLFGCAHVFGNLFRPLVGLGDEHTAGEFHIQERPEVSEKLVSLRLALTGSFI